MLPLDLALFQAINADTATWPVVITAARWASQQLPLAMAGVLVGALATGGSRERSALAKALASMALAWLAVQLLRHAVPAPRPAQLGIGIQWIEHAARATFPSMHAAEPWHWRRAFKPAARPARWCCPRGALHWPWAGAASAWACTFPRTCW